MRTALEDAEVTRLLGELDRTVIRLWELGITSMALRVATTIGQAVADGVERGSGCRFPPDAENPR